MNLYRNTTKLKADFTILQQIGWIKGTVQWDPELKFYYCVGRDLTITSTLLEHKMVHFAIDHLTKGPDLLSYHCVICTKPIQHSPLGQAT